MARKVTVSIPDMLYEKMERWRRSFNLSKMFQDAVMEAIQKKEDFQKRIQEDLDLCEVVERLRKEKAQSEGDFYDAGKRDGVLWGKSAAYDDIMYALAWEDIGAAPVDGVLGPYFQEKFEHSKLMAIQNDVMNQYACLYVEGWQKGLREFWEEIKDKL
ncbi:MAG: hypothetical protein V2I36_14305 [Desulfopila sp.]|jgi:hypothetical protein|nr:hypothetical protein [Desulfopila sp.]